MIVVCWGSAACGCPFRTLPSLHLMIVLFSVASATTPDAEETTGTTSSGDIRWSVNIPRLAVPLIPLETVSIFPEIVHI